MLQKMLLILEKQVGDTTAMLQKCAPNVHHNEKATRSIALGLTTTINI